MCLAQGPQRSETGEARTRGSSVSSQTLYHWATVLPIYACAYMYVVQTVAYLQHDMSLFPYPKSKHI